MIQEKVIQPAKEFLKGIGKSNVAIVHGHDCDSVCSAAIIYKLIQKLSKANVYDVVTELNYAVTENDLKKIRKADPRYVIILDISEIRVNVLTELTKTVKVLIVDHHKPKGYVRVTYVNPMVYESVYAPTTYIAYKIFENFYKPDEILWLACIGTLGDHGVESCPDVFEKLKKVHPELVGSSKLTSESLFSSSELGKLTRMVDAGRAIDVRNVGKIFKILSEAKNYREVKNNRLIKNLFQSVEGEFNRIKNDFEKNKKIVGNVVFYEMKSKYNLKSSFAGYVTNLFDDKIICIVQRFENYYEASFRRGKNVSVDLSELATKSVENIERASGGGHAAAAAARFPVKQLKSFIENVKKTEALMF